MTTGAQTTMTAAARDDWSGSDDGDDGKGVTGNEGGNPGGNPGGFPGGNPGGGGSPGGISLSVMTQSEFDNISKACAVTPAVSSMLKTLYDGKKIVTYPKGHIRLQHVTIQVRKDWKSPGRVSMTTWKVKYTMNWFITCRIRRDSLLIHRVILSSRLI